MLLKKKSSPQNDELWQSAMLELEHQDFSAALIKFKQFLESYPKHSNAPKAYYWLGEIYFSQKKYVQARGMYQRSFEAFPNACSNKVEVGVKVAECFFNQQKIKEG